MLAPGAHLDVLWAALVCLLCAPGLAHAAPDPLPPAEARAPGDDDPATWEGATLESVDLMVPPGEDLVRLRDLTGLVVGRPYAAADVRRAIEVLYQLGRFETAEAYGRRVGDGVQLRLELRPQPYVKELDLEGGGVTPAVERALGLRVGEPFTRSSLAARRRAIQAVLARAGYGAPAVGFVETARDADGGVSLRARVDPGPRGAIGTVRFEGHPLHAPYVLGEVVGASTDEPLDLDALDAGAQRLRAFYRERGHWDVRVEGPELTEESPPSEQRGPVVRVVLRVEPGPRYVLRWSGVHAVPIGELEDAASVLREGGSVAATLGEAKERIVQRYERRGYFGVAAELRARPSSTSAAVREVVVGVREGQRARVVELSFPGNSILEVPRLREVVVGNVRRALEDDLGKPTPDPATIQSTLGGESPTAPGRRTRSTPGPVDVEPAEIYLERAYRAAGEEIADLYRADGHPEVEVLPPRVTPRDEGRQLAIELPHPARAPLVHPVGGIFGK